MAKPGERLSGMEGGDRGECDCECNQRRGNEVAGCSSVLVMKLPPSAAD